MRKIIKIIKTTKIKLVFKSYTKHHKYVLQCRIRFLYFFDMRTPIIIKINGTNTIPTIINTYLGISATLVGLPANTPSNVAKINANNI